MDKYIDMREGCGGKGKCALRVHEERSKRLQIRGSIGLTIESQGPIGVNQVTKGRKNIPGRKNST